MILMAIPGLVFIYFGLSEQNTILQKTLKDQLSIQTLDLNSRHLEHESPPLTTRPVWLPPNPKHFYMTFGIADREL